MKLVILSFVMLAVGMWLGWRNDKRGLLILILIYLAILFINL